MPRYPNPTPRRLPRTLACSKGWDLLYERALLFVSGASHRQYAPWPADVEQRRARRRGPT